MKKLFNILLAGAAIIMLAGLQSCKKDSINAQYEDLLVGSYLVLDETVNTNLDFSNPDATVSIKVSEYGSAVASVNIYVATGSNVLDASAWKLIKNVPYSGSTTLEVKTSELAAALAPAEITPGTQYSLQNEVVTADGRKFSMANTPTSFSSFPAYKMALTWPATAVCAFSAAASAGTYEVVQDDWADYSPGDIIEVLEGPSENQVNFLGYPATAWGGVNQKNTVVDVNPESGQATVAKQGTGGYGSTTAEVQGSGFVFSCTGIITLNLTVYYGGVPYAGNKFILKKK
ncbi:hypothetical protein [Foetidibacter luteolus]|uniref:hypothetical protein n=1 Tax=Foetidibacter luteolus TaxID=2608880 RepID=UPI00129ABCF4|nr:hypothetical protein [Foetidibacter luteolus]